MSTFYERELARRNLSDAVQMFPDGITRQLVERERDAHNAPLKAEIAKLETVVTHAPINTEYEGVRNHYITQLCLKKSQLK